MKVLSTRGFAIVAARPCRCDCGARRRSVSLEADPYRRDLGPGGYVDVTTRLVARQMSEKLGQPVIVEQPVRRGGLVAMRGVKTAPADGYTLLAVVNTIAIQQVGKSGSGI